MLLLQRRRVDKKSAEFLCTHLNPIEVAIQAGSQRQSNLQRQYLRDTSHILVSPSRNTCVCVCARARLLHTPKGESVPRGRVWRGSRVRATLDVSQDGPRTARRSREKVVARGERNREAENSREGERNGIIERSEERERERETRTVG